MSNIFTIRQITFSVCGYVYTLHVHVCGGQRYHIFLHSFPSYLQRQGLSLNQVLTNWLAWLANELQGSA